MEQEQVAPEAPVATEAPAAPETAPSEPEKPASRSDVIREAVAKAQEKAGNADAAEKTRRGQHVRFMQRDDKGRLVKGTLKAQEQPAAAPSTPTPQITQAGTTEPAAAPKPRPQMPKSLKAELASHWEQAPHELLEAFIAREGDFEKGINQYRTRADQADALLKEFQPYEAVIRAEGGTPQTVIRNLLNTAYLLRAGSPAAKAQLVAKTMQQFGVSPEHLSAVLGGQQPAQDPSHALWEKVATLEQSIQQRDQAAIGTEIASFKAQPGHEHFDRLSQKMAGLLNSGLAQNLQDAYDQALRLDSELMAEVEAKKKAEADRRALEDAQKAAAQARQRAVQVRGAPGAPSAPQVNPKDRRSVIANAVRSVGRA